MSDSKKRRQYSGARFRSGNGDNQQRNSQKRPKNIFQKVDSTPAAVISI